MSTATDMVAKYVDAETKILSGQAVVWGDQTLTMANLTEIRRGRHEWEQRVNREMRAVNGDHAAAQTSLASFDGS